MNKADTKKRNSNNNLSATISMSQSERPPVIFAEKVGYLPFSGKCLEIRSCGVKLTLCARRPIERRVLFYNFIAMTERSSRVLF